MDIFVGDVFEEYAFITWIVFQVLPAVVPEAGGRGGVGIAKQPGAGVGHVLVVIVAVHDVGVAVAFEIGLAEDIAGIFSIFAWSYYGEKKEKYPEHND